MTAALSRIIDTERFSEHLRSRGIDLQGRRVLITKFPGSEQSRDLSVPPNCDGFGRIHHFYRCQGDGSPDNALPIDVAARFLKQTPSDSMRVQVFQNAVCSWRCWYCFVDFDLLSANRLHSEFKSATELLDLYEATKDVPSVIDLSGGQPDLVPEWSLWMADELHRRGKSNSVFLWSDDNLSNDYLWKYLTTLEIERLASYKNYARVGCFKGYDEHSFSFNTRAEPALFLRQFDLMSRLVRAGFDVYGYATFTSDDRSSISSKIRRFVDLIQESISRTFPLRIVPLRIRPYSPMKPRMSSAHDEAMKIQQEVIDAFTEEISRRFSEAERKRPIFENPTV